MGDYYHPLLPSASRSRGALLGVIRMLYLAGGSAHGGAARNADNKPDGRLYSDAPSSDTESSAPGLPRPADV
ncbi:hypothetical protein KM043_016091 [Ampulex compressa]|nr:hypothetical protein KM043_016091 [Ampulex compressa]